MEIEQTAAQREEERHRRARADRRTEQATVDVDRREGDRRDRTLSMRINKLWSAITGRPDREK
jgi:hypothetical protein